jgi:hypothetical protein
MTEHEGVNYPDGADRGILESGHARTLEELDRRFAAQRDEFRSNSEQKANVLNGALDALGLSREQIERAFTDRAAAIRDQIRSIQLSPEIPPSGHNPARYPPYDFHWSGTDHFLAAGDGYIGPDRATGKVGAKLIASTTPLAGAITTDVYVGDWFYSQSETTWNVAVQAHVTGVGHVRAAGGLSSAYAGLRLFVRDHSTGKVWETHTDIYSNSVDYFFGYDRTDFHGKIVSAAEVADLDVPPPQHCHAPRVSGLDHEIRKVTRNLGSLQQQLTTVGIRTICRRRRPDC